jgi:hypothetical protein
MRTKTGKRSTGASPNGGEKITHSQVTNPSTVVVTNFQKGGTDQFQKVVVTNRIQNDSDLAQGLAGGSAVG